MRRARLTGARPMRDTAGTVVVPPGMIKLTTTVTNRVSCGGYCNLTMGAHKGFPIEQRCRFATETSKGCFTCVLHNEPMRVFDGALIEKCDSCKKAMCNPRKASIVDEPTYVAEEPKHEEQKQEEGCYHGYTPKELIKAAFAEYHDIIKTLRKQGYPTNIAEDIAMKAIMGEEKI